VSRANCFSAICVLLAMALLPAVAATAEPIRIQVDLTDAPRNILHADMSIPVQPGALTLLYPKWLPGEHGPTGPISDLAGIQMQADGAPIAWQRDPIDMYTFHVDIPKGVETLNVHLDFLAPPEGGQFTTGASTTPDLAVLSWNTVLLYPSGRPSDDIEYAPSLRLPGDWKFGTALQVTGHDAGTVRFAPVSLTTLVDSPVMTGRYFRVVDLDSPGVPVHHELDLVADAEADLAIPDATRDAVRNLVREALALFGSHHYPHYTFLLTLSDHVASFGLEHHASSDDRVGERSLIDPVLNRARAGLLPHEFVHSWNGKYRRPAGLATPDYEKPMIDDALWVYEGLTTYLGHVLTSRSGLWTPEYSREELADVAGGLTREIRPGRTWRALGDTTRAAQTLYGRAAEWSSWRRSTDFYNEGLLVWLEVDSILRQKSHGKVSIDDFCHRFHGGGTGLPEVRPYTRQDIIDTLNGLVAYDWAAFFKQRIDEVAPQAPLSGLTNSGWKLVYDSTPNQVMLDTDVRRKQLDLRYSLGLTISTKKEGNGTGDVKDVIVGSPAARAGLAPGMKIVAVDGRAFTPERMHEAIEAARQDGNRPIELLTERDEVYRTYTVDYHDGERYPHLERMEGTQDTLSDILRPHAQHVPMSQD